MLLLCVFFCLTAWGSHTDTSQATKIECGLDFFLIPLPHADKSRFISIYTRMCISKLKYGLE